LRRSIRG